METLLFIQFCVWMMQRLQFLFQFVAYSLCTAFIVSVERRKHLWRMFHISSGQNFSLRNTCVQIYASSRWDSSRLCVPWHLAMTMQCIMEQIIRGTSPGCTFKQMLWICWFAAEKWISQRYRSPTQNWERGSRILEVLKVPSSFILTDSTHSLTQISLWL